MTEPKYSQSFQRRKRALIANIAALAVIITDETDYNICVNYMSYIDVLSVDVAKKNDRFKTLISSGVRFYLYEDMNAMEVDKREEYLIDKLTRIKTNLISIATKNKIPYKDLFYSERMEIHKDYHLH